CKAKPVKARLHHKHRARRAAQLMQHLPQPDHHRRVPVVHVVAQHLAVLRDRVVHDDARPEGRRNTRDQQRECAAGQPRSRGGTQMWITRSNAASTLSCIISDRVGCGKTVWMKSVSTSSAVLPMVKPWISSVTS